MGIKQIVLIVLLAFCSQISLATEYYIATSDLNVRTGKGVKYPVSFTLQKGSEVEVISKTGGWCVVNYLGKRGYVYAKYLEYNRTISDPGVHTNQQTSSAFSIWLFIVLALFSIFFFLKKKRDKRLLETVTDMSRGVKSERSLVLKLLKYGMPAHVIFHDLYVEKSKSEFSQIDLVIVSNVGIIVMEVKDYSGWIYGSGNQLQWTQVLAYGKQKYRFYNPIMQNNKHVTELKKQLRQFSDVPFYSIVVFYGDCVLKEINFVPNGTFLVKSARVLEVLKIIFKENETVNYSDTAEIFRVLRKAVINGGIIENQIRHKENISNMLGMHRVFK